MFKINLVYCRVYCYTGTKVVKELAACIVRAIREVSNLNA